MLLPGIGEAGQEKLAQSSALILGCGALGTVAADMLSRAGVGHLTIVDRDIIETTNLQRQVLFDEDDVAARLPKAEAARRKIARSNSSITVTAIVDDINHTNIESFAAGADILVDGLDNFETRYLANDVAVKYGKPYVYAAAVGTTGMQYTILPHGHERDWAAYATPCFRCLFEEPPPAGSTPTCDTVGVIGPVVGIVANTAVSEALKILTGNYAALGRELLNLDVWTNEYLQLDVSDSYAAGDCPCCKHQRFDYLSGKAGSSAALLCGRDAVQLRQKSASVDLAALAETLGGPATTRLNEYMLVATIDDDGQLYELTVFPDGRALIKGTQDISVAKSIYARFVGT